MKNALKIEFIKAKSSNYLKIALIIPLFFLVFTIMSLISSQNPSGLVDGESIIQNNMYNLWSLILLPVTIVMIISSDLSQEKKSLGLQHLLANNWSFFKQYWAKTVKIWLLVLLSQLVMFLVTEISNLFTTKSLQNVPLLFMVSIIMWVGSLPLIVINMYLLRYLNTFIVNIINIALTIGSVFFGIVLSKSFWINPWSYASRTAVLLRINPNGSYFSTNNPYVHDIHFIILILISVIVWLAINYLISIVMNRKKR